MSFFFVVKDSVDVLFCYSDLHPGLPWAWFLFGASHASVSSRLFEL